MTGNSKAKKTMKTLRTRSQQGFLNLSYY